MNTPAEKPSEPRLLGQGAFWQDLVVGERFKTFRRTVTEADLVSFIGVTGMLEEMFIDVTHGGGAIAGRPVPAALTYCLIEGFILQSLIQGTGLALLEVHQRVLLPVRVGDTVHADIEVLDIRPTSKGGRAVVKSRVDIINQREELVITYTVSRLLSGRAGDLNPT